MQNKWSRRISLILLSILLVLAMMSPSVGAAEKQPKAPKYVFMFIGDGLGGAQRSIAEIFQQKKLTNDKYKLTMNTFPVAGINTTHSSDTLVTDSAAAGTALATGHKTNNGYIAVDVEGKKLTTILEEFEKKGMATGLITTTRLTHATPAAFAAHNISRNDENAIAEDYLKSGVEFFAGGGVRHFIPQSMKSDDKRISKSKRKDDRNLLDEFAKAGYQTFYGQEGNEAFNKLAVKGKTKVFAALNYSHMPYEVDRINENCKMPSLAQMTQKGIEVLSQYDQGFFLMVEGGRIDHACHANDATGSILDTLAFDKAIDEAMAFYQKHPSETLILAIGDHETGGLGLGFGTNYFVNIEPLTQAKVSVEDNLCYAYDGDREKAMKLLNEKFGLKDLTEEENALLIKAMDIMDKKDDKAPQGYGSGGNFGGYSPFAITATHILSERANINWTTYAHSGTAIPLSALGVGEAQFGGYKDNTEIAKALFELMGFQMSK